jgi:hypothetical protein
MPSSFSQGRHILCLPKETGMRDEIKLPEGRDAGSVRTALASCNSFEEVRALGVLFHGSCEQITGELQGGGYDGVFWTADRPSVAQAYIPRSGSTTWLHEPREDERGDYLKPSKHIGFVMRWALDRAGVTMEDLDVTWNGLQAWRWTIPDNWPNEGDFDDMIRGLGYEPDFRGCYTVSTSYSDAGEEIMPADWTLPGQLIIALPQDDFTFKQAMWSEDGLGYASHNRVADFDSFSQSGQHGFSMEDCLQSDHHGNVGHEAFGILPEGIKRLSWLSIPAVRHDGPDMDVFAKPETPAFVTFMKEINPNYKNVNEIAVAEEKEKENRLYAIMTDSHQPCDKTILARMSPARSKVSGFWTDRDPEGVWLMKREDAEGVLSKLHWNNPRIVRAEKALSIIEAQRDALLEVKEPFERSEPKTDMPEISI